MILTNKQYLRMMHTHAQDNIRSGKIQNVFAADLVVEGLQALLASTNLNERTLPADSNAPADLKARTLAAEKFIQAYHRGSGLGCFLAGLIYRYGFGIDPHLKDLELGNSLIIVAAKGYKDPVALYFNGMALLEKNDKKGIQYLDVAAKSGLKESAFMLAVVYLFRADIVPTSYIKAIPYLQQSDTLGLGLYDHVKLHLAKLRQQPYVISKARQVAVRRQVLVC